MGHRRGSDPAWLWLWCGPAAVALIGPLAWEPPYTVGVVLEKAERQKKKKKKKKKKDQRGHMEGAGLGSVPSMDAIVSL